MAGDAWGDKFALGFPLGYLFRDSYLKECARNGMRGNDVENN